MKYLGKTYLHKFLKEKGFNPPMLKSMAYGKYRGDEWLKNEKIDIYCVRGKAIFVSELEYDEELDMFCEVSRHAYYLDKKVDWIKHYERQGNKILLSRVRGE